MQKPSLIDPESIDGEIGDRVVGDVESQPARTVYSDFELFGVAFGE